MKVIDVGILLNDTVGFSLNGSFLCDGVETCGESFVSVADEKVKWRERYFERLVFIPQDSACSFTIYNVVIGVDFHWERREEQKFKGELHFFVEKSQIRVVNRVNVEEYLISVISSEMSSTSSFQLLKAHAVISRSWLYAQLEKSISKSVPFLGWENEKEIIRWYVRENHSGFDFCADDHCQRYQGIGRGINNNVLRAVKETENIVLVYEDSICDARFSKCCGGITECYSSCWENEEVPYLSSFRDVKMKSVEFDASSEETARYWIENTCDSFCAVTDVNVLSQVLNCYDRDTNDFYRWSVDYTQEDLSMLIWRKSGIDFGVVEDLLPMKRGASGRIIELKIVGSKKSVIVGKELEIRRWLSDSHLYSSAFVVNKITENNGSVKFVLNGAGWGHGVGLCQIGAAVMGEQGYDFKDILAHYYPGTELKNATSFFNESF